MDCLLEHPPAEFDRYAAEYDAGLGNPLKKCLGGDAVSFVEVKADWLLRAMRHRWRLDPTQEAIQLLDYGCGTGTLLSVLRRRGYAGLLAGCDVSAAMLAEARRRWSTGPLPCLSVMENGRAPWESQFDLVVMSAVLHHVEPSSRPQVYEDALRLVKPGGQLCVFEHSPFNPVTQWVVRHTPIDEHAVLLRPAEVRRGLARAGVSRSDTRYLMFFPPRWQFCRPLEGAISWLPLGAQYVVWGTR